MRLVHLYGSRHLQLSTAMMWSEVAKAKLSRIRDNGKMLARVSLFTGAALLAAGRFKESEPYYIQGLGLAERHRQNDPGFYAIALNEVGNRELESGEIEIAEQAFRRSLDIRQSIYGPDHPHVAVSFHNLALVLYVRRQFANAAEGFRRALAIRERRYGPSHPSTLESLNGLGASLTDMGRQTEGTSIYRRVLALTETHGTDNPELFAPLNNLGNSLINQGNFDEAEKYLLRAKELLERIGQAETADYSLVLYNLGALSVDKGAHNGVALLTKCTALREKIYGSQHLEVGISLSYLSWAHVEAGQYAQAEPHARRAIQILSVHPSGILELGRAHLALAKVLIRSASTRNDGMVAARQAALALQSERNGLLDEARAWIEQTCSSYPEICTGLG